MADIDSQVIQLVDMGIDPTTARDALTKCGGNVERALDLVFNSNLTNVPVEEVPALEEANGSTNNWPVTLYNQSGWQYSSDVIQVDREEENRGRGHTPNDFTLPRGSSHELNPEQLKNALKQVDQNTGGWGTPRDHTWDSNKASPPGYSIMSEEDQIKQALAMSLSQQIGTGTSSSYQDMPTLQTSNDFGGWGVFNQTGQTMQYGDWGHSPQIQHPPAAERIRSSTSNPIAVRHTNDNFNTFTAFVTCLFRLKRVRKLFIEMESLKSGSEPPTPIVSLYTDGEMNLMDFGATSETKNELIRSESAMSLDQEVVAIEDVADNTGPRATLQLRDIDLEGYWKGERWVEIMGGFRNHEAALQLLFSMMSESFRSYLIIDPLPEFLSLEESTARTQSPSEFCRDLALHFSQGIEAYFEQRKKSLVEKGIMDEEVSIRELDMERTRVLSLGLDHDPKSVDPPDLNPVFHLHMPFLPTSCPDLSTYLDRYFYQNPPEEGFEHPYLYSVADHLILPIVREALPAGTWGWGQDYDRTILSFPKVLRVDKYLYDNREQIMECRKSLTVLSQKEEALLKEQKDLSTQDGKNWSDCLQRLADYFTTSEAAPEEEERGKFHQEAKEVFEKMKSVVERRGIEIDEEIKQIQQNKSTIWERDVFHQHDPYVLEAVLMHDGGKERKSVWSYVRVVNGEEEQWWRVDDQVTPVDEAHVFTDPAGFALNAGTCMLFYGREKIESLDIAIPQRIRAAIDTDNAHLYAEIEQGPQD